MKPLDTADTFGAIDADADELLLSAFEDHEAYLEVMSRRRFLIVGRKGAGKTAIFKKLLTIRQPHFFCIGHTFSDYPWQHHARQARIGIPDFDKFTHSWKYLILLTTSKIILNSDASLPVDDAGIESMARIEKFVVDTYGSRDPDVTQVFTPSKRLRLKPHFEIDWKILKAGVSPESVPMDELPTIVQEVNANLLGHVLRSLNPANEYHISFDQLDLGFDPSLPDYSNRLIGLLLACRDINLAARAAEMKLFVSVLLRDDIYDSLQFEDKNKLTENFVSTIEWDTPRTSHTLRQLMEKRFEAVLASKKKESVTWEDVFDEDREMPGRQQKYGHITDRTYLRPRDIIKFSNEVLKQYKARRAADPKAKPEKFDNADIHAARPEYSDYLLRELDDEVHKHIPDYKNLLALLSSLGVWQFELPRFEEVCAARADLTGGRAPLRILQDLFTFSIVGFYRSGGKGLGGSEYVFRYKEPRASFDTAAQRFRVHSGLIDALGLKRFEGTSAGRSEADQRTN